MIISNNTKITKNIALLFSSYLFFICCTHSTLLILHYLLPSRVIYFISVCCKRVEFSGRTSGCLFFPWDTHTNVVVRVQRLFLSHEQKVWLQPKHSREGGKKNPLRYLSHQNTKDFLFSCISLGVGDWIVCVGSETNREEKKRVGGGRHKKGKIMTRVR